MRTEKEIESAVHLYSDGMYRLALNHCIDAQAQDIVQEAFLRYIRSDKTFEDADHLKAWLYRVVLNLCTDYHRHWWQKMQSDYPDQDAPAPQKQSDDELLSIVRSLPPKEATAIYLHYYEEASAGQIAGIMNCRPGTVYSLLSRGRNHLKKTLEDLQRREALDEY